MLEMLHNIVKNFMKGPSTRLYPFTTRKPFAEARGNLVGIDEEACIYCGMCQRKCPADAIVVERATKTWTMNPYKCVVCGVCVEVCPKKCMNMDPVHRGASKTISNVVQQKKAVEAPPAPPAQE
jgi:formate hydrogenlyase subunit 6/NADH:ubiquinone oxidoreductase subunit I